MAALTTVADVAPPDYDCGVVVVVVDGDIVLVRIVVVVVADCNSCSDFVTD